MKIICPTCGNIVKPGNTFCNKKCFDEWQRQYPNKGSFKNQRGPNNAHWKGGLSRHTKGYIYEYCPEHPGADKRGYILQHRKIAGEKLGGPLKPEEVVDHRDAVKDNNQPDNLVVYGAIGLHSRRHIKEMVRAVNGRFIGRRTG